MNTVATSWRVENMLRETQRKISNAFLVNIDIIDSELEDSDWDTIKGEYERNGKSNGQGKGKNIQKDK
jgi:hypothetical protein